MTRNKLYNYREARPGFVLSKDPGRLNVVAFSEFWNNPVERKETVPRPHSPNEFDEVETTIYDGSKPIPNVWINDYLKDVQQVVKDLTNSTGELHVVAVNLVSCLTDDKEKPILKIDPRSDGKPRIQASNHTFWVDPENIQSFRKSQFSNIDGMQDFGNYEYTALAGKKDEESRGYIKLLDGGYWFLENRIFLDITADFETNWVRRPDAMSVQSSGNPNKKDWVLKSKPYAVIVSDTLIPDNSGLYVSPEFPGYKVLKEKQQNSFFVGKLLNLVQTMADVDLKRLRKWYFTKKNSEYLKATSPTEVTHKSEKYGIETMFVLSNIEFATAVTEKDLDGAATLMIDGNLMYTQPLPKE